MFATLYCLMLNFHPKLDITPITCLRSFGQNKKEPKFITISIKFWSYINHDDLRCFGDACDNVVEKEQKQAVSDLCMIEIWMVYRCLKNYFDSVVKIQNAELTDEENVKFQAKAECNSFLKEYSHCYLCKFPLGAKEINPCDVPRENVLVWTLLLEKSISFARTY